MHLFPTVYSLVHGIWFIFLYFYLEHSFIDSLLQCKLFFFPHTKNIQFIKFPPTLNVSTSSNSNFDQMQSQKRDHKGRVLKIKINLVS